MLVSGYSVIVYAKNVWNNIFINEPYFVKIILLNNRFSKRIFYHISLAHM